MPSKNEKAKARKRRYLERKKVEKYGPAAAGVNMAGRHGTTARGERHGTRTKPQSIPRGESRGSVKLTTDAVARIWGRIAAGEPLARIAADFGVNRQSIANIRDGRTWRHVTANLTPLEPQ